MGQWRLGSANRSIRLMLSGLLCIGLVCGCGGGGGTEENKPRLEEPDPFQRGGPKPKQRQKLSGSRGKERKIKAAEIDGEEISQTRQTGGSADCSVGGRPIRRCGQCRRF